MDTYDETLSMVRERENDSSEDDENIIYSKSNSPNNSIIQGGDPQIQW